MEFNIGKIYIITFREQAVLWNTFERKLPGAEKGMFMKELILRNIVLNSEKAKICVPLTGSSMSEMLSQAETIRQLCPDMAEFRADYLNIRDGEDFKKIFTIAEKVSDLIDPIPMIFTVRTVSEGGNADISFKTLRKILLKAAERSFELNIALIDVECYNKADDIRTLIKEIHDLGAFVIGSHHNFEHTPEKDEIVGIYASMDRIGADVLKTAFMPEDKFKVEENIQGSIEANELSNKLIVSISMSELGAVTRAATALTKSCITFASGAKSSAPGQIDFHTMKFLLNGNGGYKLSRNIVLIGFMGTGKTTVSRALSRITGFSEVDSDAYIVEKEGRPVSGIFAEDGEEAFRDLETKALSEIIKEKNIILSCGGGAVLREQNVDILKENGVIVQLYASPKTVYERVKDHTHRPVLNSDMSLEHVTSLMKQRESIYEKAADIRINVDESDRVKACAEIIKKLREMNVIQVV